MQQPPPEFWQAPAYNQQGRQQLWIDGCVFTHDSWCGCNYPILHLLSALLPPGHKDRDLTVEELISRETKKCLSGGLEEKGGTATIDTNTEETEIGLENLEDVFTEDAIDELLAAAADDVEPR